MRWPWRRREPDTSEEARAETERLHAQRDEVEWLAQEGRRQTAHNHFGEGVEVAMKRRYA